jgi:serine phosphatase RsbU (regulator of sigma subunit)
MKLRVRLIVAFLLLSVVPLGAVTAYSYVANYRALKAAATREADRLATDLSQRMQLVTAQLSERVEHLMDLQAMPTPAPPPVVRVDTELLAPVAEAALTTLIQEQAADTLGEAAMLLNSVELRGVRGAGGGRGRGGAQGRDGLRGRGDGQGNQRPPGFVGPIQQPEGLLVRAGTRPTAPPSLMPMPRVPDGQPGETDAPGDPTISAADREAGRSGEPPVDRRGGRIGRGQPGAPPAPPGPSGSANGDDDDRIQIDVRSIGQEVFRELVPAGTQPNALTPEQQRQVAAEIQQRMTGITQGIKLAALEIQRKADETRKKAEDDVRAAQAKAAATITRRRSALTGNKLAVTVEQNGKILRTANAEVNLPNVLMTVFSSMPTAQGEVPFAVGRDGLLYTPTQGNRTTLGQFDPARLPNGASMIGEWVVVMTPDPTGSGLRFGIARPVSDSLGDLRRTTTRNAGLGLAFIGLSIVLIVPLSGRLTRNLSLLTDGVKRIASGEYSARVKLKSKDEIGQLAKAFNQMAADVQTHQRTAVERERLMRELELGRQIQHDMQPQEPLRLGLTEIQGVSVPAREVGGDFFNYFALPDGHVALLVGDVSGKGVGAALLMANIQASLRTRFALGQDLSAIVDAIDRDIDANSPGQMYATMFVGILDPKTRQLRYVNAGHHPQYVLRAGAALVRMSATGLPAGLLAGRGYKEERLTLDRGDLIFFYTDGCPETENAQDEMFGTETLEALLVSTGPAEPAKVLQRVEAALKDYRGACEPYDDATMMAVRVG